MTQNEMLMNIMNTMGTINQRLDSIEKRVASLENPKKPTIVEVGNPTPTIPTPTTKLYSTEITFYAPKDINSWKSYECAMNKYITAKVTNGQHCDYLLTPHKQLKWNKDTKEYEYNGVSVKSAEWVNAKNEYRKTYIYIKKENR